MPPWRQPARRGAGILAQNRSGEAPGLADELADPARALGHAAGKALQLREESLDAVGLHRVDDGRFDRRLLVAFVAFTVVLEIVLEAVFQVVPIIALEVVGLEGVVLQLVAQVTLVFAFQRIVFSALEIVGLAFGKLGTPSRRVPDRPRA